MLKVTCWMFIETKGILSRLALSGRLHPWLMSLKWDIGIQHRPPAGDAHDLQVLAQAIEEARSEEAVARQQGTCGRPMNLTE